MFFKHQIGQMNPTCGWSGLMDWSLRTSPIQNNQQDLPGKNPLKIFHIGEDLLEIKPQKGPKKV